MGVRVFNGKTTRFLAMKEKRYAIKCTHDMMEYIPGKMSAPNLRDKKKAKHLEWVTLELKKMVFSNSVKTFSKSIQYRTSEKNHQNKKT